MPHSLSRLNRIVLMLALLSMMCALILTSGHEYKHIQSDEGCSLCVVLNDLGYAIPPTKQPPVLPQVKWLNTIDARLSTACGFVIVLPSRAPPHIV